MIDGFVLKKLISVFIHLIPGVLILLILFLLLRRWMPRLSLFMSFLCVSILIASSTPFVSNILVSQLEDQYPVMQSLTADTDLVHVLGYGHEYVPDRPINTVLSPVALARITEGVRLWKTKPDTQLIVSGALPFAVDPSHAVFMEKMALELGVPQSQIIRFDHAYDTEDEINSSIELLPLGRRLVVVSSATHLPRAAMLLGQYDALYSLAPTDFIVSEATWSLPGAGTLLNTERALHEWLGMLWYRLRNYFRTVFEEKAVAADK